MKSYNKLSLAIRTGLLTSVAASLSLVAAPALAQEDSEARVERIEVTGSRIRRTDFESSVPVTVITAEEIRLTGATNVADVLQKTPVAIAGTDQSNSTFSLNTSGINTTSLRNAGVARTLVLVNGRRFVSGTAPSAGYAVDLNMIPTSTIERIEVLKSASSAVYGSDAVAGVINIITKSDFEGATLNVQASQSAKSDRERFDIDMTVGRSWNTGSAWVSFGYHDDQGIDGPGRPDQTTDIALVNGAWVPVLSSYAPIGWVNTGPGKPNFRGDGEAFTAADQYDRGSRRQLIIPLERKFFAANLQEELNDDLKFYSEFNWMQVGSSSRFEPTPLNLLDVWLKDRGGEGGHNIESSLIMPQLLKDNLLANGFTDLNQLSAFGRRLTEFGDRGNDATRTSSRFVAGLDWFINDNWRLDTHINWGQTVVNQFGWGELNMDRALFALDLIEQDGQVICRDQTARLQGCVPFNVFGENTITPEAVEYLSAPSKTIGLVEQRIVGSVLSGELDVELPGGAIGLAAGVEYRQELGRQEASDLAQIGATSSNRQLPTNGSFTVRDLFLEARLPVLDNLAIDAAIRHGNYSTVGNVFTWNLGVEFSPTDRLKLRASAADAVRAPNVSDLFAGNAETFASVTDPCNGTKVGDTGTVAENCLSIAEIATRAAAFPDTGFLLSQTESQTTGGFIGGNPDVNEETARTYSFGAVMEFMDGLSATVDWYSISIEDAIATTSRTLVVRRCFEATDFDPTCGGRVQRNQDGVLVQVNSGSGNENHIDVEGFDAEIRYRLDLGAVGTLTTDLVYSYLHEYNITSIETGNVNKYAGETLYPRHRATLNIGYKLEDFNAFWRMRYWHSNVNARTDQPARNMDWGTGGRFDDHANNVSAVVYHDLQLSYQLTESLNFYAGMNNVFDKKPPLLGQNAQYAGTGTNTVSEAYDITGRYYYLGLRASF
ncbi:TonB-dependent receptor plug domain-containing protein [Alkalimonas amylolytica]|uniref:TonB-dependent Receptor Plug Domain n=1 Tax=Alkalimonas amylolytica TaxID=152573 RepID=A0A1H4EJC0_ALKAM|nr:TonB-dependent receptor [Alkalimonas amylolytica]SEA84987.1 TonB-dependent Receptor Plug Domain [Alkalimonas amylolytica]